MQKKQHGSEEKAEINNTERRYTKEVSSMVDGHIHIERGEYTLEWIGQFVNKALEHNIDEIWLLEHCYRFREFVPMYDSVCSYSEYIDEWF